MGGALLGWARFLVGTEIVSRYGRATFIIPSNAYSGGQSYLCFSRHGLSAPNPVNPRATRQTIFGWTWFPRRM